MRPDRPRHRLWTGRNRGRYEQTDHRRHRISFCTHRRARRCEESPRPRAGRGSPGHRPSRPAQIRQAHQRSSGPRLSRPHRRHGPRRPEAARHHQPQSRCHGAQAKTLDRPPPPLERKARPSAARPAPCACRSWSRTISRPRDAMPTTAGSLALKDNLTASRCTDDRAPARGGCADPRQDQSLRMGEHPLHQLQLSGWSAVGGLVRNPYALDRSACGSSSGTGAALAASFAPLGIGTETDGSVVCPSSMNGLVGLKPTVGLVSRTHVVPISHSQDTPGPMARSVRDVAILFSAMVGSDPTDPATKGADAAIKDYAASSRPTPSRAPASAWSARRKCRPPSPSGSTPRSRSSKPPVPNWSRSRPQTRRHGRCRVRGAQI